MAPNGKRRSTTTWQNRTRPPDLRHRLNRITKYNEQLATERAWRMPRRSFTEIMRGRHLCQPHLIRVLPERPSLPSQLHFDLFRCRIELHNPEIANLPRTNFFRLGINGAAF